MTVLDIGAGRGANAESKAPIVRSLYKMKMTDTHVIGLDVDPVVLSNPLVDRAIVYDGETIPMETASVDLVVSDYTFEHIANPERFSKEIERVLRPGGWVCARTPYLISLLVLISSVVPNRAHQRVLKSAQPGRKAQDVFPTVYKMNTFSALRKLFGSNAWKNFSYTYSPEPSYHFNSRIVFRLMQAYQYLKRPLLGGEVLMVFMQKR
jgi:ubiquinone/menaquinone biosynthesis C-methylase UbiE